jgi:hypothetical protein
VVLVDKEGRSERGRVRQLQPGGNTPLLHAGVAQTQRREALSGLLAGRVAILVLAPSGVQLVLSSLVLVVTVMRGQLGAGEGF